MSQQPRPFVDISTVTSAQRAQILREEAALLVAEMEKGGIDTLGDIIVTLEMRVDEIEGNVAAD
jgi:hypothetical protein